MRVLVATGDGEHVHTIASHLADQRRQIRGGGDDDVGEGDRVPEVCRGRDAELGGERAGPVGVSTPEGDVQVRRDLSVCLDESGRESSGADDEDGAGVRPAEGGRGEGAGGCRETDASRG